MENLPSLANLQNCGSNGIELKLWICVVSIALGRLAWKSIVSLQWRDLRYASVYGFPNKVGSDPAEEEMKKNMQPLIEKGRTEEPEKKNPVAVRAENNRKETWKEREGEKDIIIIHLKYVTKGGIKRKKQTVLDSPNRKNPNWTKKKKYKQLYFITPLKLGVQILHSQLGVKNCEGRWRERLCEDVNSLHWGRDGEYFDEYGGLVISRLTIGFHRWLQLTLYIRLLKSFWRSSVASWISRKWVIHQEK